MILSNDDILKGVDSGEIGIKPFRKKYVKPTSYEIHLGKSFLFFDVGHFDERVIDVKEPVDQYMGAQVLSKNEFAILPPGGFGIAVTDEVITLGGDLTARVCGLSDVSRLGLMVSGSGAEPITNSKLMLTLYNGSPCGIRLYPGMPIARLVFEQLKSEVLPRKKGVPDPISGPKSSQLHKSFKK